MSDPSAIRLVLADIDGALPNDEVLTDRAPVAVAAPRWGGGAATLAERLGVRPDAIATLGDMPKDGPAFTASRLSFTLGDAPEAMKAEAPWITAGDPQDGGPKEMERPSHARRPARRPPAAASGAPSDRP